MNYYNEFNPFAAAWLHQLIGDGLIPPGDIDTRSITDVVSDDIHGYTQAHFFCGIGGWPLALQLAGVPPTTRLWTGSPPCQPFSTAGKQKGQDDERHLWPTFFNLIRECSPPTIFGEQVENAVRWGWLDDLQTDLEAQGYATAAAVLPACSVGAPHKRNRLFIVGHTVGEGLEGHAGHEYQTGDGANASRSASETGISPQSVAYCHDSGQCTDTSTPQTWTNPWRSGEFVKHRDGKARLTPFEPALQPLADGVSNRVELLRGAGNAIVPQVAAQFIRAAGLF